MELLSVVFLISILAVAGGFTIRNYWLKRSLDSARTEIITEMRGAQQRAMAESHPVVYGLQFTPGSGTWRILRFDPDATPQCSAVEEHEFSGSVIVSSASFPSTSPAATACSSLFGGEVVLFFPRGTAIPGEMSFTSPLVDGTRSLRVLGITGRVEEL